MRVENMKASNRRVVVVNDDPHEGKDLPPIDDSDEDDPDSEASDSEGDKENHWDPDAPGGLQRPLERLESKRQRRTAREERRARKRRRVADYYMNAYYAAPVAMSLFKMSRQANHKSTDLLWMAAVSLTAYYDQELVEKMYYDRIAWDELKSKLDPVADFNSAPDEIAGSPDEELFAPGSPAPGSPHPRPNKAPRAVTFEKLSVRFQEELRLTLYKHWTLEDSIMHSSYFYGTMELHRDKGQRYLKNFFVTAGISLKDYQQQYSGVSLPIRHKLHEMFREHGKFYGLQQSKMFVEQFVREVRALEDKNSLFLHELSCIDTANVIITLLAAVPASLSTARMDQLPQNSDGSVDPQAVDKIERQAMVENFYRALDTVACKDTAQLREGVADAVATAKQIATLGRILKDGKAIHFHAPKRLLWCKLEHPSHHFRHHLNVRRLGLWLLQVLFIYRPKGESAERSLLVVVRDRVRNTYLLVGTTPAQLGEQDEFGNMFRNVTTTDTTLRYRYDFFDKSCIEVNADDFDRFWEILCR
jgi:hypothetical protein